MKNDNSSTFRLKSLHQLVHYKIYKYSSYSIHSKMPMSLYESHLSLTQSQEDNIIFG